MTTIVMNTANGAVCEYDWSFQSITPLRAADDDGLYTLGGDDDNGTDIVAELRGGKPGGGKIQNIGNVFLALYGTGDGVLIVMGKSTNWEYPVVARPSGVAAAKPGRGIRESYLGFGYRNVDGAAFRIDRIDAEVNESKSRRN